MKEDLSFEETLKLLHLYAEYCKERLKIYSLKKKKCRLPNFPEDISENLVKYIIKYKLGFLPKQCSKSGDLIYDDKKIEVKCFASSGPSSFGPTEKWTEIYFLDARDFINENFKLFQIKLSNDDLEWRNIKVSKTQTFFEQCIQKRRPRICFNLIRKQLSKDKVICIFSGKMVDIKFS